MRKLVLTFILCSLFVGGVFAADDNNGDSEMPEWMFNDQEYAEIQKKQEAAREQARQKLEKQYEEAAKQRKQEREAELKAAQDRDTTTTTKKKQLVGTPVVEKKENSEGKKSESEKNTTRESENAIPSQTAPFRDNQGRLCIPDPLRPDGDYRERAYNEDFLGVQDMSATDDLISILGADAGDKAKAFGFMSQFGVTTGDGVCLEPGIENTYFWKRVIPYIIKRMLDLGAGIAVVIIVVAGVQMAMQQDHKEPSKTIIFAVVGLLVMILSRAIVSIVQSLPLG